MRSSEILTEEANYTYEVEGDWKQHAYITMYSFDPDTAWLLGNDPVEIGAASIDFDRKAKSAYISRIDITRGKSEGNGTRFLAALIDMFKKKGYKEVTAYIVNSNMISKSFFSKNGFTQFTKGDWDEQHGINVRKDI